MTLNPLPALTWNWLRMNKANFLEEAELKKSLATFEADQLPHGVQWEQAQSGANENGKLTENGGDQNGKLTENGAPKKITGALGQNFDKMILQNAARSTLTISAGTKFSEPIIVRLNLKGEEAAFNELFIDAGAGSEATVIITFDSAKSAGGLNAARTTIRAAQNAKIKAATIQTLGKGFVHLNDIATIGAENSLVEVAQLELGAQKIFFGAYSTLSEPLSLFKHNAAYFMDGEREIDMNFVALQTGAKTQSDMNVYGTLKDSAKKTYRGTIDFRRGCAGAIGDEQEETLLLSPDVVNKSIPLILCDEEDVQGEHGATIGRLDESVLFYMNARGISLEEAQKMMARAKIARVAALIGTSGQAQDEAQRALDFFDGAFGDD